MRDNNSTGNVRPELLPCQKAFGLDRFNSFFDGYHSWPKHTKDEDYDWEGAWIDNGPSPAGNTGPYVKLAYKPDDTVHRIYPKQGAWRVFAKAVAAAHTRADVATLSGEQATEQFSIGDFVDIGDGCAGRITHMSGSMVTISCPERRNGKEFFVANRASCERLVPAAWLTQARQEATPAPTQRSAEAAVRIRDCIRNGWCGQPLGMSPTKEQELSHIAAIIQQATDTAMTAHLEGSVPTAEYKQTETCLVCGEEHGKGMQCPKMIAR